MAAPDSIFSADSRIVRIKSFVPGIFDKSEEFCQGSRPKILFISGHHRTSAVTGTAQDTVDKLKNFVYLPVFDSVSIFRDIPI